MTHEQMILGKVQASLEVILAGRPVNDLNRSFRYRLLAKVERLLIRRGVRCQTYVDVDAVLDLDREYVTFERMAS